MPSSRPNTIPTVIHLVRQIKPNSILDVGVGFGKWGHLFREYTDINEAENDPARYQRRNWRIRIDGIEGYAAYLTPMHRYLYDQVHVGNAIALLSRLPHYDLIFLGDVIEHLEKEDGLRLLRNAFKRASKAVIVTTPKFETGQADLCGNELERHRSLWSAADFEPYDRATVKIIDRATLLAVLPKPGLSALVCSPPKPLTQANVRRLQKCRDALVRLIPPGMPFILVDDDQMRSDLPHARALPFLEKNGKYWGPPADDATAIRELARLRRTGARYIAFTWPAYWWTEHYGEFYRHLCEKFRRVHEDDALLLFDLQI
jgi:hypothetical protein